MNFLISLAFLNSVRIKFGICSEAYIYLIAQLVVYLIATSRNIHVSSLYHRTIQASLMIELFGRLAILLIWSSLVAMSKRVSEAFLLMYMKELTQPPNDGTSSDGSVKTITIKMFIRHTRTPSLWMKNHHFIAQRFVHLYRPLSSAYNYYKPMSAIRCHHDYRWMKITLDPKGPRVEVEYYEHLQNYPTTAHPQIGVWKQ